MSQQRPGDTVPHQQEIEAVIDERLAQSGSGGLPGFMTANEDAATLEVAAQSTFVAPPGTDNTVLIVGDIDSSQDPLVVTDSDHPGQINFGTDQFGYVSTSGIAVTGTASVGDLNVVLVKAISAAFGRTRDVVQFCVDTINGPGLRIDHSGNCIFRDASGAICLKVDATDGTVHIKTGGSIVADL